MLYKFSLVGLILVLGCQTISGQANPLYEINCQFKLGFCKWTSSLNTWRQISNVISNNMAIGFSGPARGPFRDSGFIQVYTPTSTAISVNADLISPQLKPKFTSDCVSFYYYIHGEGVRYIDLLLINSQGSKIIWTRRQSAGDMWHLYSVNIGPQQTNYQLKFQVSSGYGAVALASLSESNGLCLRSDCDFESGNCNWTSTATNPNYNFKLTEADSGVWGEPTNNYDHTTESDSGHFMETSGGNTGDSTNLTSPVFNYISAPFCLRFWYWRHLSQNNKIEVIMKTPTLTPTETIAWSSENRIFPSKTWHRAQVSFFLNFGESLIIRATKLASQKSPVDIDDISLVAQSCPQPINCDFDQDMCGWTRDLSQNWIWDHGIGRVENSKVLPTQIVNRPLDRRAPDLGMFMYTDFTQKRDTLVAHMIMTSEYVSAPVGGMACFAFFYSTVSFTDPKNQLTIIVNNGTEYSIKTLGAMTYSGWQYMTVDIQSTQFFRISMKVTAYSSATYIAVDDITYKVGSCNSVPTVSPVMPTLPTLSPIQTMDCDFETGLICNWKNTVNTGTTYTLWAVVTASYGYYSNPLLPNADHTKYSGYGRYAYIAHTQTDFNNYMTLKLATMNITNNGVTAGTNTPFCFSLWYYARGTGQAYLNINVKRPDNSIVVAITRSNQMAEKWQFLQFETPGDKNGYILQILGLVRFGVLAIDDIKVEHQSCQQSDPNVFRCTFEGGNNCSFIPTYIPGNNQLNWLISRGDDTYIKTYDHTLKTYLGHLYSLDFHILAKDGFTTSSSYKILSKYFPPTEQSCVTFSYLMTGLLRNESLNFYVGYSPVTYARPIWSAFGDLGRLWYSHRVTISSPLKFQIGFDVLTHNTEIGLIGIDDVMVEVGRACPPKGFCDFERKDTCMWESLPPNNMTSISQSIKQSWANIAVGTNVYNMNILQYPDFEWVVHSPDTYVDPLFPIMDHTLNKRSGNYLLLKGIAPRRAWDRAVLVSDHFDIDSNRSFCLSLFYYIKNPNNIGNSKFEIYQAENYNLFQKIGEVIGQSSSANWMQYNITAKALSVNSKNMWFYLVGDIGTLIGSAIAIDDISITSGNCVVSQSIFVCVPSQQTIPKSKVCDGVRDCSNGADEIDCGSCTFKDNDDCGFNTTSEASNDPLGYKFRTGNYTTGPKSGPYGESYFKIAQTSRYSYFVEKSYLVSPKISSSKVGCYITFFYNLNGSMTGTISSRRWSHLSILITRGTGFETTEIWNSDVLDVPNGLWRRGFAFVGRVQNTFNIMYRAIDVSPSGAYGYVALSNIRMNGCYIPFQTNCNPSVYNLCCQNGNYVSKNYLCDYSDDCGDGSDELPNLCTTYTNRCDFENGLCGWGRLGMGSWKVDDGFTSLLMGPTRDHTKGIRTGQYLVLRSNFLNPTTSDIYGPTLLPTSNCRMRFWYSMEGNSSTTGSIMILSQNIQSGVLTPLWRTFPSQFPANQYSYIRQEILIPTLISQFRIIIRGSLSPHNSSSFISYIAIDDISFTPECTISTATVIPGQSTPRPIVTTPNPCGNNNQFKCKTSGQCIDISKLCNFHDDCGDNSDEQNCGKCGFEQTDALGRPSMCGWHNTGFGKNQWVVRRGSDLLSYSGNLPKFDSRGNTDGKFLIVDTSSGGTTNVPAVLQSAILGATSPNCKISFAYRHVFPLNGRAILSLYLYKRNFLITKKHLFTISTSTPNWKVYTVEIGKLLPGYQIQFEGYELIQSLGTRPYIDMALDEIQFVDCDPTVTIAANLTCDFEYSTCGWYDFNVGSNNKLDWMRENSQRVEPGFDHTSTLRPRPSRFGYWMSTHRNPGMVGNDTATLMTSGAQPTTTGPKCLTFWYHLFGRDSANFSLIINTVQSPFAATPRVLWVKRTPQSNNWVQGQINIPPQNTPYYLMFRASLMANSRDTIGLDDITYSDGVCPSTSICDFEVDFCNWVRSNVGGYVRSSPSSPSSSKIPPIDHTLGAPDGNYIKVNVPNQNQILSYKIPTDISVNHTLPISFLPREMCLKFWYYMGSTQVNGYVPTTADYFNVSSTRRQSIDGTNAKTVYMFNNYQQWLYRRVNLDLAIGDSIYISAAIASPTSVVAFDDIQVQKYHCEQPGSCDFENDFCGYTNGKSNDMRQIFWLRNTGETESDNSGPERDHTTDTDEGWYVYVPEDAQTNGVAILQSEYLGPYTSAVCFSFYYHILSENSAVSPKLNIQYVSPFAPHPTQIVNISSSSLDRWILFRTTLSNLPKGRFQFITFQGQISRADVALDDILVQPGVCGQIQSTSQPMTTQEPIQNMQWDCNYETASCKWTNKNIGWKLSSWSSNLKVGPRADHTMRSPFGHYLLFDGNTTNAANPAIYTSDPVNGSYNYSIAACFSFWYYVDSESKFNLTFGYYPTTNQIDLMAMYKISGSFASRQWKLGQRTIYVMVNSRLALQLQYSTPFIGSIAIDDIRLTLGECKYDSGQECDFSTGYCGYQINRKTVPILRPGVGYVIDALARSQTFGPKTDHTTGEPFGFYFWFTKPLPANNLTAYTTDMIIPDLPAVGFRPQCLRFWYQISSSTISSFYIFVKSVSTVYYYYPDWVVPYTQLNQWTRGQLTIKAQYKHKIIFSLKIPSPAPDNSFVAIDDISLTSGECEAPVSCDFDTDMCSWSNVKSPLANTNWAKFTGPPGVYTDWFGPNFDHTLGRSGGSYLYLTLTRNDLNIQRTAVIESMITTLQTPKCLSFWTKLIGNDTSIEAILVRYGQNVPLNNQTYLLSQPTNGPKSNWTKISFTIDPNQFPNTYAFQVRIRGKLSVYKSFIALDDVFMSEGVCPNPITNLMFCKGIPVKQYDPSKRCDFVYDCPQKDDEDNCGNCDFEKDTCNWINKAVNEEQWVRRAANDMTARFGPKTDGQNSNTGHYMIVNPLTKNSNRADLSTNRTAAYQLKRAYFSCVMAFKYYMSANALRRNSTYFMVNVGSNINYDRTVWRMNGQTLDQWTQAFATIGDQDANFNVEILGAFTGQATVLAVDDIQFKNCNPPAPSVNGCPNQIQCKNKVCVSPYVLCDGVNDCGDQSDESLDYCRKLKVNKCTFEPNQGSRVACNWTQEFDTGSNALWRPMASANANRADNMIRMTGPTFDRTFRIATRGTFMVLKGLPKDYGKKTRFVTHMVTAANGQTCALRFFYYMFGSQIGSLSISIRHFDPNIKSTIKPVLISENQGQQWKRAIFPVSDQTAFQFIIEGQVGTGPQSDIAIDEISFSEGCLPSDKKPIIMPSTTGPNVTILTSTKSTILNKNTPNKPNSNSGKIAAGVLVPLFVIGAIIGFLYYRRYQQRKREDDRVAIADQVFYSNDSVETHLDRKNPNNQK